MRPKLPPNYLAAYPAAMAEQVLRLIGQRLLAEMLLKKYPLGHAVRANKGLHDYVLESKDRYLRNAGLPSKVAFDGSCRSSGTRWARTPAFRGCRVRLKTKREIRVAAVPEVI